MQIFVTNFNMFKIELENRDFRKSLYFYIVDAGKKINKKRAVSGCCHYSKSRAYVKWTLEKNMGCGRLPAPGYLNVAYVMYCSG